MTAHEGQQCKGGREGEAGGLLPLRAGLGVRLALMGRFLADAVHDVVSNDVEPQSQSAPVRAPEKTISDSRCEGRS